MKRFGCLTFSLLILCLAGCGTDSADQTETDPGSQQTASVTDEFRTGTADPKLVTLPSGVRYIDLQVGTGEEIVHGTYVQWDYSLFLADQAGLTKIRATSSSLSQPEVYYRGQAGVTGLPGLTEGVVGMKVGGLRRIHVPWELGWGDVEPMPKQNLIFEIQGLALVSREEADEWQEKEFARRQLIIETQQQLHDSIRQDSINQAAGH